MISKKEATEHNVNVIETDNTLKSAKQERIAKIKELLPSVINSDNQIDLKALYDLVGIENTTSNNQGYELTFAGKGLARAEADRETTKELKAEIEQSKNFDATGNVIIRGDNIDSLKILYKNYHNKINQIAN
jgi:adenine-specific DNA-methyltransferase